MSTTTLTDPITCPGCTLHDGGVHRAQFTAGVELSVNPQDEQLCLRPHRTFR